MNSLTLQWDDAGTRKSQNIYDQQPSKNHGTVRIGRDPKQCDIVFTNPTVSGLHVEIFFNSQQRQFFIRNLRSSNPPVVDGQQLMHGELPLSTGSIIHLGHQTLQVSEVSIPPVGSGLPPTVIATPLPSPLPIVNPAQPSSQPIVSAQQENQQSTPDLQAYEEEHKHTYGLQCPKCGKVSPIEHLQVGCPWCGTSLAAAVSVLVAPKKL